MYASSAMDLSTLGVAMGSAWLSGVNLYATVLTLGLLQRFGFAHLPGDLAYVSHSWVLLISGVLFTIQFIADKIPVVDSAWDMVHTFIRIPAGAILAATAFAHFDPSIRLLAFLLGGGVAASSHSARSATRLAANTSPEPFSNIILSLIGDFISVVGTLLVTAHPVVLLSFIAVAVVLSVWLSRRLYTSLRRLFGSRQKSGFVRAN